MSVPETWFDPATELLTPEEIEATTFPESERGYDAAHVDAFVLEMAKQARRLAAELVALEERSSAPYMRVGKEMAELLDHARRVAEGISTRARAEAGAMTAEAAELREQASAILVQAEERARETIERARAEAKRITEEAAAAKRLVEVQASIAQGDLKREAEKLKKKAEGVLAEARGRAEQEFQAARVKAEQRVRKLDEMEKLLRRRIMVLDARRREAEASVDDGSGDQPAPPEQSAPPEPDSGDASSAGDRPKVTFDDLSPGPRP